MRHKATVFEQLGQQFPWHRFEHHVRQHGTDDDQRGFTSRQQFLFAMLAAAASAAIRGCVR